MWNPSSLVPPGMHLWLLIISAVLLFTVNRSMKQLVAAVVPPPLRLQFAWSGATASKILDKWSDADKRAVRLNLALDFVFVVIYVAGLTVACALAANALDAARWPYGGAMGELFVRAIIIAGFLDAVENVAQLLLLAGQKAQPWPALASFCASIKFVLATATILYALYGGAAFVCHYLEAR